MKKSVVFLNGNAPLEKDFKGFDFYDSLVVCADGAYRYVKDFLKPNVILGDFDSIDVDEIDDGAEIIRFSPEKDYTDGHLAVQLAIDRGAEEITVFGAFGGRPDHEYSNLSLLYLAKCAGVVAKLIGAGYCVTLENGRIEKTVAKGAYVSLVPFFQSAHILSTKGLKYPMKNVTLDRLHILGISNEALSDSFTVETDGELLVFIENL